MYCVDIDSKAPDILEAYEEIGEGIVSHVGATETLIQLERSPREPVRAQPVCYQLRIYNVFMKTNSGLLEDLVMGILPCDNYSKFRA